MAKRRRRQTNQTKLYTFLTERRVLLLRLGWVLIIVICTFFGYTNGYPIVAEGQTLKGILIGLAYGGGAFMAIVISLFLNRKLKGL